eukprot:3352838-Amphidinium_carterae.1
MARKNSLTANSLPQISLVQCTRSRCQVLPMRGRRTARKRSGALHPQALRNYNLNDLVKKYVENPGRFPIKTNA